MSRNKSIKKSIYILTEGLTEQAYFSRIAEIVGEDIDSKYSVRVEVREIVDGVPTDPANMVREAKRKKKDYDEVWVVFDRDRQRDPQNLLAIQRAANGRIRVAYSSIAFEHWLILHFERNDFAFQRESVK